MSERQQLRSSLDPGERADDSARVQQQGEGAGCNQAEAMVELLPVSLIRF